MEEYVTQEELENYVTQDQYNGNMRELATDLKGELLYRPAQVDVTIEVGFGAQLCIIGVCLVILIAILTRWLEERY